MENLEITQSTNTLGTRWGNAPVPLSVLDAVLTGKGYSAAEVLKTSIELARLVDRRGFTR